MPRVEIVSETEHGRGWRFIAEIQEPGVSRKVEITLSWADHERWSAGAKPPSEVAAQALRFAASNALLPRLGSKFDASTIRRMAPGLEDFLLGRDQDAGGS